MVRSGSGTAYSFEITDQQGTSLLTLDDTAANPVWRQFTPYGAPRGKAPVSWPDTNGFLGKPTDANTGLTTVGARQYDPTTGRFLSVDPVQETDSPQQLDGFTYAEDNPVTNSDPSGLMVCVEDVCGGTKDIEQHYSGHDGHITGYEPAYDPYYDPYYYYPALPAYYGPPGDHESTAFVPEPPVAHITPAHISTPKNVGIGGPLMGCAAPTDFRFGSCPGEIRDIQEGLKQSHISGWNLLLMTVMAFIPVGGEFGDGIDVGDAIMTGTEASGDAAGAAARDVGEGAADACGGMSFTANTRVLLPSGVALPIDQLRRGDKVLATDTRTGKTSAEPVTAVLLHHDTDLYDLTVRTGHRSAVIRTTDNHLFWDQTTHRWTEAAALGHGNRLRAAGDAAVEAVAGAAPEAGSGDMWDLTVLDDHDFYVGAGSADILVHNCPAPPSENEPDWAKQSWNPTPPRETWSAGTAGPAGPPASPPDPDAPGLPSGNWAKFTYIMARIFQVVHGYGHGG